MTNSCTVDEALKEAHLPEYVVDKRVKLDLDSTGEQAVWIWVVLSDEKQDLPSEQAAKIRDSIRHALRHAGIELWTYVRFRTESEQSKLDKSDKAWR